MLKRSLVLILLQYLKKRDFQQRFRKGLLHENSSNVPQYSIMTSYTTN